VPCSSLSSTYCCDGWSGPQAPPRRIGLPETKFTSEEAVKLYVRYRYSILMPERF